MDNSTIGLAERLQPSSVNGSARRTSPVPGMRPTSLMDSPNQHFLHVVQVIVNRNDKGYGMKVSGDNPVYVQSVKEGGASEKAGLHAGDKILKVNDVDVTSSRHTEVVNLIKASSQVILTVQQRATNAKIMGSPSLHNRPFTTPSNSRITSPQPVDHEKQYQLQLEKEQHYRLMIEKEQRYIDILRSQIASSPDEKKYSELNKTERNLQTLQAMLMRSQSEQSPTPNSPKSPMKLVPSSRKSSSSSNNVPSSPVQNLDSPPPPPLPKRNNVTQHQKQQKMRQLHSYGSGGGVVNNSFVDSPIPNNSDCQRRSRQNEQILQNNMFLTNEINESAKESVAIKREDLVDNLLYSDKPPPLPPRTLPPTQLNAPNTNSGGGGGLEMDAANSINKQMSYPLVATCATLVNDYSPNPTHHRTKSSPESLSRLSGSSHPSSSKRASGSGSMDDLRHPNVWEVEEVAEGEEGEETAETPPGTPPPPYPSPSLGGGCRRRFDLTENEDRVEETLLGECSSPDSSPFRASSSSARVLANSSPIHAANPQTVQQPIISMEDDEISDQEMCQIEDHGFFKSLSKLWEHPPHLAVFMNYIFSNSDPNSLLFYLLTDLYKEGNAKEMRKWAFEIHSCFLVPGAPLRFGNVDENIAREIDEVLAREIGKEEILRKIFWKARSRAKEELSRQLVDFQQKRIAGLGTIYGPTDCVLAEIHNDKAKETKLYESLFLEKLEPYLAEVEKENFDAKKYYTAAALTTVLTRVFGLRPTSHSIDRCPTFVSKEKSFRTKFMGRYSRKLSVQGHTFAAQQYYTVILCNNCHHIIYGIGPQGYQCSVCLINLHRLCVKLYDDTCPGPINKKDRGLGKFIRMNHNEHRRKHSSTFIQMEKDKRQSEDAGSLDTNEIVNDELKMTKLKKSSTSSNDSTKRITKEVQKSAKNSSEDTLLNATIIKPTSENTTNSYLKRVRSKIYKTTTKHTQEPENPLLSSKQKRSSLDLKIRKDEIPEESVVAAASNTSNTTNTTTHRRSLNFDFRLIRQTSNLEQVRTSKNKTPSGGCAPASADVASEKPVLLTKAKSSSAINLNLLRTRRNRLMEQLRERKCKDAVGEFDFIAFGGFRDKFGGSQRIPVSTMMVADHVIHEHQVANNNDKTDHLDLGEGKSPQPVSRSGSDRRPDVVREEISKNLERPSNASPENDTGPDGAAANISEGSALFSGSSHHKKRSSANINRSESVKEQTEKRKQRRNISDPSHNTTSGDVDLEQPGFSNTDSGSSSNSSISYNGRLSESPSNDVVSGSGGGGGIGGVCIGGGGDVGGLKKHNNPDWDSDVEMELANWQKRVPEELLRNLPPHEKNRQDVINELFHTEGRHVKLLWVLYDNFFKTLMESQTLKPDELSLIFPNIEEILRLHVQINEKMKLRRDDDPLVGNLGDMLMETFGGTAGENLQKAAATFCERQQSALEFIKDKRKRDSKFDAVLVECEKKRQCRRLPLQGIVPTEMQRLSKYPLLLERLIGSTEESSSDPQIQEELTKLRKAQSFTKNILNYVNEATKLSLNRARLEDIQRHLDTSNFERSDQPIAQEFRALDLTRYKLLEEGVMQLQRHSKGQVPVYVLLLEEAVVLLQKENEKYLLKFFQSGNSAHPQPLSPIIKMSTLLVRKYEAYRNALLLINTSTNNSQMYNLSVEDEIRRELWLKHFSDATAAHKEREKTRRPEPPPDTDSGSETVQELHVHSEAVEQKAEAVGGTPEEAPKSVTDTQQSQQQIDDNNEHLGQSKSSNINDQQSLLDENGENVENSPAESSSKGENSVDDRIYQNIGESLANNSDCVGSSVGGGGGVSSGGIQRVTAEDWPLIQSSQVHVEVPPVHMAESRLTHLEQIRRKDEEVRKAIEDKEGLVADLFSIPREHFRVIADMAGEINSETQSTRDLSERVMAAVYQVDQLHLVINESLNVTEASAAVMATGGKHPSCQSQLMSATHHQQSSTSSSTAMTSTYPGFVSASRARDIASSLSLQLTSLLSDVKQIEEDRDRLRKEVHKLKEILHEKESLHGPEDQRNRSPTPEKQRDLESIKENPTDLES